MEKHMNKEQFYGIARAVLAAVGGYFVGRGMLDHAAAETIVGAVATLATAIWSVWSKKE
jgi:RsiW-degrading membrane proteinase PrsW (M82 family)